MSNLIKSLILFFVIGLSLSFSNFTFASTSITNDIESDTTWTLSGSPYIVENSIVVFPGVTLTIEPGVGVKFKYSNSFSKNSISVFGKVVANGREDNKVYFTSSFDDEVGADTDDEENCYDELDIDGNPTGVQVCEVYDTGDPQIDDWGGLYFDNSVGSTFKNVTIRYANANTFVLNQSTADLENIDIEYSRDGLVLFGDSHVDFSGGNLRNINDNAIALFNNSSFVGESLKIENILSTNTDAIVVFNNSDLSIKNSFFKDCPDEACITFFDGSDYVDKPSSINIENTLFDGGLGSGLLTFGDSDINAVVKNSVFKNFADFAIENYSNFTIDAKNNDWGDVSGPFHEILNALGLGQAIYGNVDFDPWIGQVIDPTPEIFYAKIKDAPNGVAQMYSEPNTTSTLIKTFPNDWVLKVFNTTLTPDGWVKIQDMTDESFGWINLSFKYEEAKQGEYENVSKIQLETLSSRRDVILKALDNYYNNSDTLKSLFNSDDSANVYHISKLKNGLIPQELILAIFAQESGSVNFNNENVSFDYGHGITQVTMHAKKDYTKNSSDPRGVTSLVKNYTCRNFNENAIDKNNPGLDEYKNCYKGLYNSKGNLYANDYDNYGHDPLNTKYKQYSNTEQSIYANIKDGLSVLSSKYGAVFNNPCSKSIFIDSLEFTCQDLKILKTVWGYNGAVVDPKYNYMRDVSNRLKNLTKHFPDSNYDNSGKLIEKLLIANNNRKEIKARSPIEVRVKDSSGNIVGLVHGETVAEVPNSSYDADTERAVIFFPDDTYTYEVVGDSTGGTYGLDIDIFDDSEEPIYFRAIDLPIIPGEIHIYRVDEQKLKNNEPNAVSVSIDKDGDGVPERVVYSGGELTSLEVKAVIVPFVAPAGVVNLSFLTNNKILAQVAPSPVSVPNIKENPKIETVNKVLKQPQPKKVAIKTKRVQPKIAKVQDVKKEEVRNVPLQASVIDTGVNFGWFRRLLMRLFNH